VQAALLHESRGGHALHHSESYKQHASGLPEDIFAGSPDAASSVLMLQACCMRVPYIFVVASGLLPSQVA
jgi:hypothetical protein